MSAMSCSALRLLMWFAGLWVAIATNAYAAQPFWYFRNLDSPFVPTNQATVDAMLRIANVNASDYVVDLGSGDGRILITAARRYGAHGLGVDLDPDLVKESLRNARMAGVADRVRFEQRDLFDTDVSKASVVTLYLLPEVNLKLRPRLLAQLRPGTRIVSHGFGLGDWQPDLRLSVRGTGSEVLFWIVPAAVAGKWSGDIGGTEGTSLEIEFKQNFQEVDGSARRGGRLVHLRDARIEGDRLSFVLIDDADHTHRQLFEGQVREKLIEGTVRGSGSALRRQQSWKASKLTP
jgi:SAM-dependent methyltransferase